MYFTLLNNKNQYGIDKYLSKNRNYLSTNADLIPISVYKQKTHLNDVFRFGTPIGNRTLVSAVRGRRLEPLDHEGKSILLCDNSIIYYLMQAKL